MKVERAEKLKDLPWERFH